MARWVHFNAFGRGGPAPGAAARRKLLADLTAHCAALHVRPVDLVAAEAWKRGERACFRITVECEPGSAERSPASWFEWKHPRWDWSAHEPPDLVEHLLAGAPA